MRGRLDSELELQYGKTDFWQRKCLDYLELPDRDHGDLLFPSHLLTIFFLTQNRNADILRNSLPTSFRILDCPLECLD